MSIQSANNMASPQLLQQLLYSNDGAASTTGTDTLAPTGNTTSIATGNNGIQDPFQSFLSALSSSQQTQFKQLLSDHKAADQANHSFISSLSDSQKDQLRQIVQLQQQINQASGATDTGSLKSQLQSLEQNFASSLSDSQKQLGQAALQADQTLKQDQQSFFSSLSQQNTQAYQPAGGHHHHHHKVHGGSGQLPVDLGQVLQDIFGTPSADSDGDSTAADSTGNH